MTRAKPLRSHKRRIQVLEANGIHSIKDFLQYFPRDYEDRTQILTINQIPHDLDPKSKIVIKAKITALTVRKTSRKIIVVSIEDRDGNSAECLFFNATHLLRTLRKNQRYRVIGTPQRDGHKLVFFHPELLPSAADEEIQGEIFPIYPELMGVKAHRFAQKMRLVIDDAPELFPELYPRTFLEKFSGKFDLIPRSDAIRGIHFPDSRATLQQARTRRTFDKIMAVHLANLQIRHAHQDDARPDTDPIDREILQNFTKILPFELTTAQKKVIKSIVEDFHLPRAMLRLLQGDVGSGKTVVAMAAAFYAHQKFGGQTAFLIPLEILAKQHFEKIAKLFVPAGLRVELLTGTVPKKQKDEIKKNLESGAVHVVVGTHALLQDEISYKNLTFVTIDEQHKFGVRQRSFFKAISNPHILQMSATPIPRSLALLNFGEFDVSIIDQLPHGDKKILTKVTKKNERKKRKPRLLQKISDGHRIFVISPLIDESEKLEGVANLAETNSDRFETFPELSDQIGVIHGKMPTKQQDEIMKKFKSGEFKILLATTVIEVGVDIPEASIMFIRSAERFGLSQLHQLRGRIGRTGQQSYCFLESDSRGQEARARLKVMEDCLDGFKLAEHDLAFRGAGEIMGTRQSGRGDLPTEILRDPRFIEETRAAAERLRNHDPDPDSTRRRQLPDLSNSSLI